MIILSRLRPFLWNIVAVLLLCCTLPIKSWAQPKVAPKERQGPKIIGDTTSVYYSTLANPTELQRIHDGLKNFEEVVPTWDSSVWYSSLGNILAAPSFDLVYQPPTLDGGFRVGFHQFDPFILKQEHIKYYEVDNYRPFTELYYSQLNQRNNYIKADFGYRFNPNVYFGVQYSLVNQAGYFDHQRTRNQNIGYTMRFMTNNNRYHSYFSFFNTAIKQEDNWGIRDTAIQDIATDFLTQVAVNSTNGNTRYNKTSVQYSQFFYNKGVDSLSGVTNANNAWSHSIRYAFNRYKYFDKFPPTDNSLYGLASVNPRGIRLFIRHQELENEISFRQAVGGTLSSAPLWFKIYGKHRWNLVYQEPITFNVHNFSAGILVQNNPQFKFKYRVQGQLTWAERQLDFFVKGRVGYDLGKLGYLEGQANIQRYQPSLVARQLYVSSESIWDNNLTYRQVQTINFGGSYTNQFQTKLVGVKLRGTVLNHTLTNWIYYTKEQVQQAPTSINLLQVKAAGDIRVWRFHLDNEVIWQPTLVGKEYFRVPELLLQHNLYWQDWIFKRAMLAKVGVRFNYNSNYFANAYSALTGAFYLQNNEPIQMYPRFDAYASFRIWQFRFFARAENIGYFVYGQNYFTAYQHPITNFVVRIGISWRLFD
ncbi:MAG: putative porin [Aureispira sp.]